ncbi:hypothetical protein PC116_g15750 [Phytophthora cactorum]|nr:hypothetical protein Pcac1_g24357 [Phytophthora cactorum]KAG2882075.1 hypothetical protein PC114_g21210 [Phytophthora cactorum]KAG2983037.1 hypothetical protein PC119_g20681 [Phytophthora cactorum]KAG3001537.1 hypothetical protein PC120_g20213 [Phytophthora cactorum]KAG3156344.1 hypothetical protein PC128_g21888 [Phytophthora cactorum]
MTEPSAHLLWNHCCYLQTHQQRDSQQPQRPHRSSQSQKPQDTAAARPEPDCAGLEEAEAESLGATCGTGFSDA